MKEEYIPEPYFPLRLKLFITASRIEETNKQYAYSLAQKQWIKFSIEKSLVFFSVNLFKNLHASTYTILLYIYKVKKIAADGNPEL